MGHREELIQRSILFLKEVRDTTPGAALLGSVGQYCANNASCPVVIMRGKREG